MRINITLPDYLVKDVDCRAKVLGTSRSAYIATALQHKAQYDDMMKAMPKMMELVTEAQHQAKKLGNTPSSCSVCVHPCKDDHPDEMALCDRFEPIR